MRLPCCSVRSAFQQLVQKLGLAYFSRSAFSTALFAAVMYAGAVPNGSKPMKVLMPIRGELSVIASILTLGHNISYGLTYFRLLFTRPDRLAVNQLLAAVCSLVMLCIMVPLFITSFKCVRRKMKGSSWKNSSANVSADDPQTALRSESTDKLLYSEGKGLDLFAIKID